MPSGSPCLHGRNLGIHPFQMGLYWEKVDHCGSCGSCWHIPEVLAAHSRYDDSYLWICGPVAPVIFIPKAHDCY